MDDAGKIETEWRAMPKIWAFPGLDELARKRISRRRARDVWELARLWDQPPLRVHGTSRSRRAAA